MNDYGLMAVESGDMLALRGADVSARITGLLAETTLVQKYRNDTDANLELSYTFPLPVSGTMPGCSPSWRTHRKLVCTTPNSSPTLIRCASIG